MVGLDLQLVGNDKDNTISADIRLSVPADWRVG